MNPFSTSQIVQTMEANLSQLKLALGSGQNLSGVGGQPNLESTVRAMVAAELAKQTAPVAQPKAPALAAPPMDMRSMAMQAYGAQLVTLLGEALSEDQQMWLSANLGSLPNLLSSQAGKEVISTTVEALRNIT